MRILSAITLVILAAFFVSVCEGDDKPGVGPSSSDAAGVEFFEKRIRPLLAENCYQCHGPKRQRAGLRLDSLPVILKGGDRGPAIVAGSPDQSLLVQAVRYHDDPKMPPTGKLKDTQIDDLVAWVKMGAPGPRDQVSAAPAGEFNLAERRKHWAYQPVQRPELPPVKNQAWCKSPIDFFILSRLEKAGLTPAPPADRRTLLRRVTFDLTGLPPTPAEVDVFVADPSPNAFEKVVDRLLASPHYGERWARHWLDVVRFSETLGFEFDFDLWNAWRYRDYVIRAFNTDLPYDQFVIEHIAGDLLPPSPPGGEGPGVRGLRRHPTEGFNESILATGFYFMGEGRQNPVDIRQEQGDQIENQIDVLSKAFLAQTIACARCHDHKFDAVSTRDYYALVGYMKSSRYQQAFIDPPERIQAKAQELAALRTRMQSLIQAELAPIWLKHLESAGRYLIAASRPAVQEPGIEAERLQRWIKALDAKEITGSDHPLFAWSQLNKQKDFDRQRQTLRASLQTTVPSGSSHLFENFGRANYQGWYVTGDAFGTEPARAGDVIVGHPLKFASPGANSSLLSTRLQGELRSSTFTIDKPYIHFRLSGENARVNLIIDGYTLLMNPMHGKLTIPAPGERTEWRTMAVDRWPGHRAHVEVRDSTIPMHKLNPPPSTGSVSEEPNGYVVLEKVVFSDDAEPPALAPNRLNLKALDRMRGDGPAALAQAYQELMIQELKRWQAGNTNAAPDVGLLNWLVHHGLLDDGWMSIELAQLFEKYQAIEASLPSPQRAPAIADGTGEDEFVYLRGNYKTLGDRVPRRPPEAIASLGVNLPVSGSGRLELAQKLIDSPLPARVMVNRIWQHHFGEGIVRTPDDFGRMGQAPTHPELLDYLASEFVRRGWSVKQVHRLMLLSSAYQMSSAPDSAKTQADPQNQLLHRMPLRRLEAEAIRDAILTVSGRLNRTMHGPSVMPYLTPYMEGRGKPSPGALDGNGRRSIYLSVRRNFSTPMLVAFDFPGSLTSMGRRGVTTAPGQALTLMNDPFVVEQAALWAQRVLADPDQTPAQRVDALYQAAFARSPTVAELQSALRFLDRTPDGPRSWAELCHTLFNVKEFIFVP